MPGAAERHEQVFRNAHLRKEGEFLRNIGDVFVERGVGRRIATVDQHLSARGAVGSGEDFDQRGFAGAVFSGENMRPTQFDFQVDAVQCGHAGKVPAQSASFKIRHEGHLGQPSSRRG